MTQTVGVAALGALLLGFAAAGCGQPGRATPVSTQPCEDFKARLCGQTANELSTTCISIKSTVDLLTDDACQLALHNVDHSLQTLAKRDLSCDTLQAKLCADTDPTTKSCETVKRYTRRFPVERCKEMLGRYPDVLSDVKKAIRMQ